MFRMGSFHLVCAIAAALPFAAAEFLHAPENVEQTSALQVQKTAVSCAVYAEDDVVDFGFFHLDDHGKPTPRGDWVVIDAPMLPLWPAVIRYNTPDNSNSPDIDYSYRSYFRGVSRRASGGISSELYDASTAGNHCFGSNPQAVAT